jgi:hypothetical protein
MRPHLPAPRSLAPAVGPEPSRFQWARPAVSPQLRAAVGLPPVALERLRRWQGVAVAREASLVRAALVSPACWRKQVAQAVVQALQLVAAEASPRARVDPCPQAATTSAGLSARSAPSNP